MFFDCIRYRLREYHLVIDQQEVQVGDKHASGMTINGSIPGPVVLRTLNAVASGTPGKGFFSVDFRGRGRDHLGDYFTWELKRMPPMDIADIAYDYFLSNGSPETRP